MKWTQVCRMMKETGMQMDKGTWNRGHKAMQEIMMHNIIQYDNGVEFFVDDPGDIDKIAVQIQKLDLDWSCFKLAVDNTAYEAAASSLAAMQNMVTRLMIGIVIVSIGILALILNMWIKQRTHGTGILLSIGVNCTLCQGQIF